MKILFIDRDGTLIAEPDDFQVDSFEKFRLEPDCIGALQRLRDAGWEFVMVSNQDGLGSDSFPFKNFEGPQNLLLQILQSQGICFRQVLICPHKPLDNCECRKPKIGLVKPYLYSCCLDKEKSFVIGDRLTDVELGRNMGLRAFLYDKETMGWGKIAQEILALSRARHSLVERNTKETQIRVFVDLDDFFPSEINTGIGFFDHMLDQIATHAGIGLKIQAKGDLQVDDHHTIEDVGLALGKALKKALGDKRGIGRFGFVLPMDECLAQCALDLSNRPYLVFDAQFKYQKVGDMSTEMVEHFFRSLSQTLGCTLHLKTTGDNDHHRVESLFKVFARALRQALEIKGNEVVSSKGVLE